MAKGLDVGTMNIIAADHLGSKTTLTQQRNTFVEVPLDDVAERMLARSQVLYVRDEGHVYVVGEDALNFANVLNVPTRRPMQNGVLSRDEKTAIPMLRLLIERLVGEPRTKDEALYFTCPAKPADASRDVLYHQKTLETIVRGLGYQPRALNEGMAAVYAELAENRFTGLGLSFGAGMTNMCLSYYGLPVMMTAVARGGDWIDAQAADATGQSADRITAIKEKEFSLAKPTRQDEVQAALAIYYEDLVDHVIRTLEKESRQHKILENLDVPIVITGGTASCPGFRDMVERKLKAASLPFNVKSVKLAGQPLYSVALGTLVAARAEEAESLGEAPVLASSPKRGRKGQGARKGARKAPKRKRATKRVTAKRASTKRTAAARNKAAPKKAAGRKKASKTGRKKAAKGAKKAAKAGRKTAAGKTGRKAAGRKTAKKGRKTAKAGRKAATAASAAPAAKQARKR